MINCAFEVVLSEPDWNLSYRSMYFDEDGDVAHEFYEEVPPLRRGVKATMRRILTNLTPQVGFSYVP